MVREYLNKLYQGRQLLTSAIEWAEEGEVETSQRLLRELNIFLISIEPKKGAPVDSEESKSKSNAEKMEYTDELCRRNNKDRTLSNNCDCKITIR